MNKIMADSYMAGIVVTVFAYEVGLMLKNKYKRAVLNPLFIAIVLVMAFMVVFKVDYENYKISSRFLSFLLTPATVCLAIPLYQQIKLLKKNFYAILVGIISGVITSLVCILSFSIMFKLSHQEYVTLLPKSITTAIGIGISEELGGFTAITVAVIIITGVLGNICAESVLRLFCIKEPIAKGIAIGTSSHAIGTAKAIEIGEIEGAMSSLAIVIAGIFTLIFASVFANFL